MRDRPRWADDRARHPRVTESGGTDDPPVHPERSEREVEGPAGPNAAARRISTGFLVALALGFGLMIVASLALPLLTKVGARTKASECRSNLKAIYTAERAYFVETHRYTTHLDEIGFDPERGNRYAYFISRNGPTEDRSASAIARPAQLHRGVGVDVFKYGGAGIRPTQVPMTFRGEPVGLRGTCPHCDFLAVCAGQLDTDPSLDVWTISSRDRIGPDGKAIPAGHPFREINDDEQSEMPPLPAPIASDDD